MSSYKILYWKEIPTQIKYTDSEGSDSSYPLSLFFQQAIDAVAMHDGSISSGEYLDAWAWGESIEDLDVRRIVVKKLLEINGIEPPTDEVILAALSNHK